MTSHTRYLFVDDPTVRRTLPRICVVRDARGMERSIELQWRSQRESVVREAIDATWWGAAPPTGIERVGANQYWVTFSISYPPKKVEEDAIRSVIERLPRLRNADLLVVDVRGNSGGNSEWGKQIAAALFTPAFLAQTPRARAPATAYFRVSRTNLLHLQKLVSHVRARFPTTSKIVRIVERSHRAMETALAKGEMLVAPDSGESAERDDTAVVQPVANPMKGTVVFLTSGRCASACLDFADEMLSVPTVLHVGQETSADTVYMELRDERLPSGLGTFYLPIKVYRNRVRANNQPYKPKEVFPGAINDDKAVRRWVLEIAARRQAAGPTTATEEHPRARRGSP